MADWLQTMNSLKEHDEFTGEQPPHSYFKSSPAVNQKPKDPSVSSFCKASQPVDESLQQVSRTSPQWKAPSFYLHLD